ncbi:DUF4271 domain-containing protein [Lutibacter sp.]
MFEASKIIHSNSDWITLVLVFIFSVLTLLKVVFKDRLAQVTTVFISKKYFLTYYNKGKSTIFNGFQVSLFTVQLLVISLLLYLVNSHFHFQQIPLDFKSYLHIFFLVGFYFSIHYLIGLLLAFLFNFKDVYSVFVYQKLNYFNNLILWLLPFLILTIYISAYQYLLLNITIYLFIILALLRYSLILKNNKKLIFNNLFYFILYLCTLEIAPLIIILKLTI